MLHISIIYTDKSVISNTETLNNHPLKSYTIYITVTIDDMKVECTLIYCQALASFLDFKDDISKVKRVNMQ